MVKVSLSVCVSIGLGYDSYEIIMKQSARVGLGAKLSFSLWNVRYLRPSIPPLFTAFAFTPLVYSSLTGWKDVLAVNDISLFSHLRSFFSPLLALSVLFLLCRSTFLFCNPLKTLRGFFSFYLTSLLLPFCFLLAVCVCECISMYTHILKYLWCVFIHVNVTYVLQ